MMHPGAKQHQDLGSRLHLAARVAMIYSAGFLITSAAHAVDAATPQSDWQAGVEVKKVAPAAERAAPKPANTTVIERAGDGKAGAGGGQVRLVALLTADGQQIDQGLVAVGTSAHGHRGGD